MPSHFPRIVMKFAGWWRSQVGAQPPKEGPPAMKAGGQIMTVQVIEKIGGREGIRTPDPCLQS